MMFLSVEILVVFVVVLIAFYLWTSTRRPKDFPPGPFLLPVFGIIPYLDLKSPYKTVLNLRKKYGDIFSVKIGHKNIIYISDFQLAKKLFNDPTFSGRPDMWSFKIIKGGKYAGIVFATGSLWQEHRRFTLRHLRDFGFGKTKIEDIITDSVKDMIKEFEETKGKPFNVTVSLNLAILNIIWHLVAGTKFDKNEPSSLNAVGAIDENLQQAGSFLPDLFPWTEFLPHSLLGTAKFKQNTDTVFEVFKKAIEAHEKHFDPENTRDLIDVYLKQMKEDERNKVTNSTFDSHQLNCVLSDMFGAGSDTTATSLKFAFLRLILHPDIQKQLQEDIHRVIGKDRIPSLNDRNSLPRVEAFILEVLRSCDIVPLGLPHATTETVRLDNYIIPKGTTIATVNRYIHNDERYWSQPQKFDPSRFIDEDGSVQYKKDGFLPFSIGKRQCLGEILAKAELFLFITGLLQKFRFSLPPGDPTPDLSKTAGSFIVHPPEYQLIVTPI